MTKHNIIQVMDESILLSIKEISLESTMIRSIRFFKKFPMHIKGEKRNFIMSVDIGMLEIFS